MTAYDFFWGQQQYSGIKYCERYTIFSEYVKNHWHTYFKKTEILSISPETE